MTAWGKSELGKVIRKIDSNTRGIVKLISAEELIYDDPTWTAADQKRAIDVLKDLRFALVQDRRNLKLRFEELYAVQENRRRA